jgi:hypothetical protein
MAFRQSHIREAIRSKSMRYGLLITLTAATLSTAAFASSTTVTTTTGGASSSSEYYIVRDPSTKKCTVTATKPTSSTMVQVGNTTFKTQSEAESQVTKVCTD